MTAAERAELRKLADDLTRATLHGKPPLETTMALATGLLALLDALDAAETTLANCTAERNNYRVTVETLRGERDEARAMAPRWVLHTYGPDSRVWRLHVGTTIIERTGIGLWGDGTRIVDIETADDHPGLPSAARAVCDRLGLPYIEVPNV